MVPVNVRNWAHCIITPAAMSWSSLMSIERIAKMNAAKNDAMATNFSAFLSLAIVAKSIWGLARVLACIFAVRIPSRVP